MLLRQIILATVIMLGGLCSQTFGQSLKDAIEQSKSNKQAIANITNKSNKTDATSSRLKAFAAEQWNPHIHVSLYRFFQKKKIEINRSFDLFTKKYLRTFTTNAVPIR